MPWRRNGDDKNLPVGNNLFPDALFWIDDIYESIASNSVYIEHYLSEVQHWYIINDVYIGILFVNIDTQATTFQFFYRICARNDIHSSSLCAYVCGFRNGRHVCVTYMSHLYSLTAAMHGICLFWCPM